MSRTTLALVIAAGLLSIAGQAVAQMPVYELAKCPPRIDMSEKTVLLFYPTKAGDVCQAAPSRPLERRDCQLGNQQGEQWFYTDLKDRKVDVTQCMPVRAGN